uniref:Uridine kinase n=1 Tax=Schistosoma mansoni TaxID=6183 RepID=A0A5K4F9J4_SCHMA
MDTLARQYVIGIAGASNSGKTTMTGKLAEYLQSIGYNVTCLQMDDYYWGFQQAELKTNGISYTFCHLSRILQIYYFYLLKTIVYFQPHNDKRHIRDPITNEPNFDCESAVDWEGIITFMKLWSESQVLEEQIRILIIEGILIMNKMELRNMMDLRIFLKITYENMLQRRKLRKYNTPDPPNYFAKYVWPTYLRTLDILEYSKDSIYYFDSNNGIETLFKEICQCVNEKIYLANEREKHFDEFPK